MFFSIIIPIYNAEKSLERCLQSIKSQTYEDYEVIMIDDGSRDNSYAICQEYMEQDARFKLIHQDNSGPSAARNRGLKTAEGRYICFVDSDDYISSEYLIRLYDKINECRPDAVFIGYQSVNAKGNTIKTFLPPTGLKGVELLTALSKRDMFGYTWIKCFFRECVINNMFPEDMFLFEDEVFTCQVLKKADHITTLPAAVYYHVVEGEGMLTGRTYENYCSLSERVFFAWEELLREKPGCKKFLERKADSFVSRCRYYGFERDVDCRMFFESLANTHFFQMHTKWTLMDWFIKHKVWFALRIAAYLYRMKTGIGVKKRGHNES